VQVQPVHIPIAIVGSGFAGMGAAIRLQQQGFRDFLIFERDQEVGGVWRDNSYPGAACDVESHLYSYSFAPNPSWSNMFSRQPEILEYLRGCAREHALYAKIRFGHEVGKAVWNEDTQRWQLDTSRGRYTADVLIAAMGGLSEPAIPQIPGLADFRGEAFHSARWNHGLDMRGRRVAVIGTGASAIQFVPAIQPQVASLELFQRTAAWVLPRFDRPIGQLEQALYQHVPALQELSRAAIYLRRELLVLGFRNPRLLGALEMVARSYLRKTVKDPLLRAKLLPSFRLGCKRILISSEYLPALTQPNVEVVSEAIREVREHSIVTADGREHEVDTIIFGTGFQVADLPFARHVFGHQGKSLREVWNGSLDSLRSTSVAGFPNLFLLLGPNSGIGHTSVIHILESQLQLVLGALEYMRDNRVDVLEARSEAQARFMERLQSDLEGTVWIEGGCASWYLDAKGRATTLWPGTTLSFRRAAKFLPSEYQLSHRSLPPQPDAFAAE
jgi:cation diffusion facilitator CzcD-associated flavoprotein CzcO